MLIEQGNIHSPSGNAIIYWRIKGNKKVFNNAEIIASNFVISPLQFRNETLMVNFPPVLIESYEKLIEIAETNDIDVLKGGDIFVPEDMDDFIKFYKSQIERHNSIIQEYLLAYQEKNSNSIATMSLPQLINRTGELMEGVRKLVKDKNKKGLIEDRINKLKGIQKYLNSQMKGFDLAGIIRIIDKPDDAIDRLVDLYKQKFLAIFLEDYERADYLKKEIIKIKKGLFC